MTKRHRRPHRATIESPTDAVLLQLGRADPWGSDFADISDDELVASLRQLLNIGAMSIIVDKHGVLGFQLHNLAERED